MIIFNLAAVAEALVVAVVALFAVGLAIAFGPGTANLLIILLPCAAWAVLDLAYRLFRGPAEGDESKNYVTDIIMPWRGGHVFFVPTWIPTTAVALLTSYVFVVQMYRAVVS